MQAIFSARPHSRRIPFDLPLFAVSLRPLYRRLFAALLSVDDAVRRSPSREPLQECFVLVADAPVSPSPRPILVRQLAGVAGPIRWLRRYRMGMGDGLDRGCHRT